MPADLAAAQTANTTPVTRRLIEAITGPADVRALPEALLPALAAEVRGFLIDSVCASGGHLGVNLGVVELTIALHRVFESPRDVLVFDTGHQAYVHKILTGRAGRFRTLRRLDGLAGYPARAESVHDWVENSHASTALSYADGLAKALALRGQLAGSGGGRRRVVAVIGDGALTGGLAWEGLNNLSAAPDRPVVVVVNDNGRSYAPTVGGIARHLRRLRGNPARGPASGTGPDGDDAPTIFEQLGMAYLGPVDGHDVAKVEAALKTAAGLGRPVVVHVLTSKGRGYAPAEQDDADRMHGVGVLDPATGKPARPGGPSWTELFGRAMADIGARRPDVVAVTAAMLRPVALKAFADRFPDRVFDVGIAEQQAVCSAAGLALGGLRPVVCLYSTFLTRAFDQVLLDVALHRLPVTFVLDRAGITGPDGPSHHGVWDTALLSVVPGLRLAAPRDPARLRELLEDALDLDGPAVIRFPKAAAGESFPAIARVRGLDVLHRPPRPPADVLLVSAGVMASPCLEAAHDLQGAGIGVTVVDPRWIVPPSAALVELARRHRLVFTVEDHSKAAGAGAALAQACADAGIDTPVHNLGLPRAFVPHGDRAALLRRHGLTGRAVATAVRATLAGAEPATDDHLPHPAGRLPAAWRT